MPYNYGYNFGFSRRAGGELVELTTNLISHFLLNNNADDSYGIYDGSTVDTIDFKGDYLDPLLGSVTIPATGGVWCSYWKDTGSGFIFTTSTTVPTSLATDNYSNLRIYSTIQTGSVLAALEEEGYYPKPLSLPTEENLIAHYPLTGTADDSTGNYNSTENSATYKDDVEFGSVYNGGGSITVNATAVGLAAWCSYWVDTGSGFVFTKTTTIPTTLSTNDYRNLRLYSITPSVGLQDEIENYEKNFRHIDIEDGLVAYYPLDNNSKDNYHNQTDLTDGSAVTYDGENGIYIEDTNSYSLTPINFWGISSAFTISFWAKPAEIKNQRTIFTHGVAGGYAPASANNGIIEIMYTSTTLYSSLKKGSTDKLISINMDEAPTANIYTHYVWSWDGTIGTDNIRIFKNSEAGATSSQTDISILDTVDRYAAIGSDRYRDTDLNFFLNGKVSNFRVYNKAISSQQVEAIYNTELEKHSS